MDNNQNNNDMQKQIDNIFNEISNSNESNITTVNTNIPSSMPTNNTQSFGVEPPKKKSKVGLVILILGLLLVAVSVFFLFIKPNLGKDTDKGTTNKNSKTETKKEEEKSAFTIKLYDKSINIYTSFASTIKSAADSFTLYYRNKDVDTTKDIALTSDDLKKYLDIDKSCSSCDYASILTKGSSEFTSNSNLLSIKGDAITNKKAYTLNDLKVFRIKYPADVAVVEKPEIDINGFRFTPDKTTKEDVIKFFGSDFEENEAGRGFGYVDYNKTGFNLSFWYNDNSNIIKEMTIDQKLK